MNSIHTCTMSLFCSICNLRFSGIKAYNSHQFFHRQNCKRFQCANPNCSLIFNKYSNFRAHLVRSNHMSDNLIFNSTFFSCNVCSYKVKVRTLFYKHLYQHIRDGIPLNCPFYKSCQIEKSFSRYETLRTHFVRRHSQDSVQETLLENNKDIRPIDTASIQNSNEEIVAEQLSCNNENLENICLKLLTSLYLKLESKHFLSNKSLQTIIDGLLDINLINTNFIMLKANEQNITITEEFLNTNNIFNMLHNKENGKLRTKFFRHKYYKTFFYYVNPVCHFLSTSSKFFYIPINETLKALFQNKNFSDNFFKSQMEANDGIYQDIISGYCCRKNEFLINNKNAIKLILYQDSFEICNPLGASRKKHKVLGVYMTIANLPPWLRTSVDHIQLIALIYDKDIKKYGFNNAFKVIVEDLKILETDGIIVKNMVIKGTVIAFVGDNLGSHQTGGFNENFNTAGYFCRYCYANNFRNNSNFMICKFNMRNPESHSFDVNMMHTTNESYRGVKSESILNSLSYFHVANPGLPPCLAHDMFEGIIQKDLMLILNKFNDLNFISFESLNLKIQTLRFTNEPRFYFPELKKGYKLLGTANQNMWLLLILPFAFVDVNNEKKRNNDLWEMILCLRKIMLILLSFKISVSQIEILNNLIIEYIYLRQKLFPKEQMKPKHHYLLHYAYLIKIFGPIRQLWTLRFESKHQYFKQAVKHSSCFKNILLSLATKHQLLNALNLTQNSIFSDNIIINDIGIEYIANNYCPLINEIINSNIFLNKKICVTKDVTFHGINYRTGMIVCFKKDEFGNYCLLRLSHIIVSNNEIFFIGKSFNIVYDNDLGLYVRDDINETGNIFVTFNDIICHETILEFHGQSMFYYYFKSSPYENF